jgi:hypothetical protein
LIITGVLEDEVAMDFTLHTEPKARDVEFTVSCLTRGGPATFVEWATPFGNGTSHETSQLILDTSLNSVYISNTRSYGQLNKSVSMNFTLHTELRASVPEFTISCRTHGGPATTVQWTVNGVPVQEDRYHETSQLILDTSLNSVYDNRLRVKGRRNGRYECLIWNNIRHYLPDEADLIVRNSTTINVAEEPTIMATRRSIVTRSEKRPSKLTEEDTAANLDYDDVSETRHTSSSCQDKEEGDNSAAIAGGVGGVMFLIIVGQSVAIVVLLLRQRTINRARRVSCKKPETWSKSDITMRVDPEHDEMIDLQKTGAHQ